MPVPVPRPRFSDGDPLPLDQPLTFSLAPQDASVLVRGESLIVARRIELLDIPVPLSQQQGTTGMEGLLSDVISAYAHLWSLLEQIPAVRSRLSVKDLSPSLIRTLLRRTAHDAGGIGYDFDHGYGIVDAVRRLTKTHARL